MSTLPRQKKLPVNPSLEHLQKQAKRLSKQNPGLRLAAAQHQLAREYGCPNWAALVQMVEGMSRRHDHEPDLERRFEGMPKAARLGDLDEVRRLLQAGEFTSHTLDQTLAHLLWYGDDSNWAARKSVAEQVLEHGADPNGQYGSGGYGPIVFGAAECVQPDALEFLIAAGADVTAPPIDTKYGRQCVMSHLLGTYLRGVSARKDQCLDLLLRHGAHVPAEVTPPVLAIHRGDPTALGDLLERDPGLLRRRFADLPYGNLSLRGATLLHCAAEFGEDGCMQELIRRGADVNAPAAIIDGVGGQTTIYHAISCAIDGEAAPLHVLLHQRRASGPQWLPAGLARFLGRPELRVNLQVRATWKRFDEVAAKPMSPVEFVTYLDAKGAAPRTRTMAVLQLLTKIAGSERRLTPMHNFSTSAQQALALARREAERLQHDSVGPGHLVLGLMRLPESRAMTLLRQRVTDLEQLRANIEHQIAPSKSRRLRTSYPFTPALKQSLALAGKEAATLAHDHVGTAHLLAGLLHQRNGAISELLRATGVETNSLRTAILAADAEKPGWTSD